MGYDSWLEKPYQDEIAAMEDRESLEEACYERAVTVLSNPVAARAVLSEHLDMNSDEDLGDLAKAMSLLVQAINTSHARDTLNLENEAIAVLHGLRQRIFRRYQRDLVQRELQRQATEQRRIADQHCEDD